MDLENTPLHQTDLEQKEQVSHKIRKRLQVAGKNFYANDNIADYIEPGDLDQLVKEASVHIERLLQTLVIDTKHDHNTSQTPQRLAKMFIHEVFRGRYQPSPKVTEFPNVKRLNELVVVGPIQVRSACSHHFCPVMGKLWIGIMPKSDTNVIGLSKYTRLAQWVLARPQIQEEATVQLADLIDRKTKPDGLALVMQATHYCVAWRGVQDKDSLMINSVMRGAFLKNSDLRKEFLSLLPKNG
jgi:GTP cyclohydrolase I